MGIRKSLGPFMSPIFFSSLEHNPLSKRQERLTSPNEKWGVSVQRPSFHLWDLHYQNHTLVSRSNLYIVNPYTGKTAFFILRQCPGHHQGCIVPFQNWCCGLLFLNRNWWIGCKFNCLPVYWLCHRTRAYLMLAVKFQHISIRQGVHVCTMQIHAFSTERKRH